jgi:hypothetical protein
MTGHGRAGRRAASPAALQGRCFDPARGGLVLLPKCPLCLAAWLTVVTGVGFSEASAAWVRRIIVMFWVAAVAFAAAPIVRRRAFGRAPALLRRLHWNARSRDGGARGCSPWAPYRALGSGIDRDVPLDPKRIVAKQDVDRITVLKISLDRSISG